MNAALTETNLGSEVIRKVQSALQSKGYAVVLAPPETSLDTFTGDSLRASDPTWVRSLPPKESRWIMIIKAGINYSGSTATILDPFARVSSVSVGGSLYDKQSGELLWRDFAIGTVGTAGLVGLPFGGLNPAFDQAIDKLAVGFPERTRFK